MKTRITEYWIYKHRYALSYSLVILLIVAGLVAAMLFIPSGLRSAEMSSAVESGQLTFEEFNPQAVINLPYHLFQRASIELLGVSELSLKLPSIILGFASVIGMFYLVKEWFRHNVAVITVLLTATLPSFVFLAQDATPHIYSIAVAIWLLACGTSVTRRRKPPILWKTMFGVLLVLNMYAPLGIYLNVAVISTIIFHPHIRHLTRRLNINRIVVAACFSVIVLAPLLYSLVMQPSIGLQLVGIPENKPDIVANAIELGKTLFWKTDQTNGMYQPIFSAGVLLIMLIGFVRFLQVKYTARSYIIWLWALMLIPLLLLNPEYSTAIIPLAMLMIAMGMNTLISEWYRLFPYNPYARVLGLLPLSVIVIGIVLSAASRYSLNYYYNPAIVNQFSNDTRLLKEAVSQTKASKDNPIPVVINDKDKSYFQLLSRYDDRVKVVSESNGLAYPYILSHDVISDKTNSTRQPSYIAVNSRSSDSDRFYLYTSDSK